MAPSLKTIKSRTTFIMIKNKGNFIKGKCFNIVFLKKESLENLIFVGYISTKKLGNAVKRNKAKRIMRELARKVLIKFGKKNSFYVIIAKNSIFNTPITEQENELKKLIS